MKTPDCHTAAARLCRRTPGEEYVLDFILERKAVSDLVKSIMDPGGRYERQKVRAASAAGQLCTSAAQLHSST